MVPVIRAGRLLNGEIGREGRVCVQILVIGHAQDPFTNGPLLGIDPIVAWLDTWGVSRRWPAGPPLPSPQSYHSSRGRRPWARGGHFGCSQVPEVTSPAPGGVDIRRITGPDTPVADIPRPRAVPTPETMQPPRLPGRGFDTPPERGDPATFAAGRRGEPADQVTRSIGVAR